MKPMLCDRIEVADLDRYVSDDQWWFQQKFDGHRVLTHVHDGQVRFLGRDGRLKSNALPVAVVAEFARIGGDAHLFFDGELVDNKVWLFDVTQWPHGGEGYGQRLRFLQRYVDELWRPDPAAIEVVVTKRSTATKKAFINQLRDGRAEGLVVKQVDGRYYPGPRRSRDVLKAKFVKELDAVVSAVGVGGHDNFHVKLQGRTDTVGSVAAKAKIPVRPGDVVTVRYLYVINETGRLYQPVLVRVRDDKAPEECTVDQLACTDKHTIHR